MDNYNYICIYTYVYLQLYELVIIFLLEILTGICVVI